MVVVVMSTSAGVTRLRSGSCGGWNEGVSRMAVVVDAWDPKEWKDAMESRSGAELKRDSKKE